MGWRRVARFLRVGKDRAGIRSGGGSSGRRNCRGRRDEANSAHRLTESLHYPLPRSCGFHFSYILLLASIHFFSASPPCRFVSRGKRRGSRRNRGRPWGLSLFWHCQQTAKLFAKIVGSFGYDSSTLTLPGICDTLELEQVDWAEGLKSYYSSTDDEFCL